MSSDKVQAVAAYLKERGEITSMEAFELFGDTRLADTVHKLRKKGWEIETVMCEGKTRYGTTARYAKYIFAG